MKFLKLMFACTILAASCSEDKENDHTSLSSADIYFSQHATYSNLAEIIEGGIAVANGDMDSVKIFGQTMVTDHSDAQAELDAIASQLQLELPSTPDSAHQAMATQLQALSGYVFDTTYIGAQIRDHQSAIADFNYQIAEGNNQQLVNYAHKYLPVIQMHLQEALNIQEMLH